MTKPLNIKIGDATYELTTAHIGGEHGHCNTKHQRINIEADQSPAQRRDTIVHEVLHALIDTGGIAHALELESDERLVRLLTPWLVMLIRDNPTLIAALASDEPKR